MTCTDIVQPKVHIIGSQTDRAYCPVRFVIIIKGNEIENRFGVQCRINVEAELTYYYRGKIF